MPLTAKEVRNQISDGTFPSTLTSGLAPGQMQANIFIVPKEYAGKAEEICSKNIAPLPLIYKSDPGEYEAPPLAFDSDIRRDLPKYSVYVDGALTESDVDDLLDFDFESFVSFYIGCSFSFEAALIGGGIPIRNVQRKTNVAMYNTSIFLESPLLLPIPMFVSLRPIPASLLGAAFAVTAPIDGAHGAPVHFGDPALIGIKDAQAPDFGDPPFFEEGDVATFWACGVTVKKLVQAIGAPLAFTHSRDEGSLFMCDKMTPKENLAAGKQPKVTLVSSNPLFYSVLDVSTEQLIRQSFIYGRSSNLDEFADAPFLDEASDFLRLALILSHSESIEICLADNVRPAEIPLALSLIRVLQGAQKTVALESDSILGVSCEKLVEDQKIDQKRLRISPTKAENHSSEQASRFPAEIRLTLANYDAVSINNGGGGSGDKGGQTLRVFTSDILSLCFSVAVLQMDEFHERYNRRGVGSKRNMEISRLLTSDKLMCRAEGDQKTRFQLFSENMRHLSNLDVDTRQNK